MNDLLKTLVDYERRGGKMLFWSCPKGCNGMVNWTHADGKHVAICVPCGNRSDWPTPPEEPLVLFGGDPKANAMFDKACYDLLSKPLPPKFESERLADLELFGLLMRGNDKLGAFQPCHMTRGCNGFFNVLDAAPKCDVCGEGIE